MKKTSSWNRLLSLVLCLCMLLSLMPGITLAAKAAGTEGISITSPEGAKFGTFTNENGLVMQTISNADGTIADGFIIKGEEQLVPVEVVNDYGVADTVTLSNPNAVIGQNYITTISSTVGTNISVWSVYVPEEDVWYGNGVYTFDEDTNTLTVYADYVAEGLQIKVVPYVILTTHLNGGSVKSGWQYTYIPDENGTFTNVWPCGNHEYIFVSWDSETDEMIPDANLVFEREGYSVVGYNTVADGSGTDYAMDTKYMLTEDLEIYLIWESNQTECSHAQWQDATCTEPKTCTACGATDGEALGHTDEDGDGFCDNCSICMSHADEDSNGFCDSCWSCMSHADEDGDNLCDNCWTCMGHADEDGDFFCDYCCECIEHTFDEGYYNSDYAEAHYKKCDRCSNIDPDSGAAHTDTDSDCFCDTCGRALHTDEDGDCICDTCGEEAHIDEDSDCFCDNCGRALHTDEDGDGFCDNCLSCYNHTYNFGYYDYDDDNHYMLCDSCSQADPDSAEAHTYDGDSDYYCNICSYCRCAHDGETHWIAFLDTHSERCETCGLSVSMDVHNDGEDADTLCDVCGFETATITVYFDNTDSQWETVRCFWVGEGENVFMHAELLSADENIYAFAIPADSAMVEFSNHIVGVPEEEVPGGYQMICSAAVADKTYVYTPYTVTISASDGGTVTANRTTVGEGAMITLTADPDDGFKLDVLIVSNDTGTVVTKANEDGTYTFTMPAGDVTVTATFKTLGCTTHTYAYTDNGKDHTVTCENCDYSVNEEHTYEDGVCICNAAESTEPEYVLNENLTVSMSISVGAEMQVMYTVLNANVKDYESFYLEVVKEVAGGESVTTVYSLADGNMEARTSASGTLLGYTATYTGIFAMEMGDNFTATLYAVAADGTVNYGTSITASIKSYLMEKLADESTSAELKTLAVDMLNYGAAAQVYFGYNAANLANADLTEEQKALGTQAVPTAQDNISIDGTGGNITTSVTLQSKVVLYVNCTYAKTENSNLEFVVKNAETGEELDRFAPSRVIGKICQGSYDNVGERQMRDLIKIELYDNGELVSKTLTWNIESYVAQTRENNESSESLVNTVNAMLNYGDSAAAYLAATGQ